jgi:hypothetical protein
MQKGSQSLRRKIFKATFYINSPSRNQKKKIQIRFSYHHLVKQRNDSLPLFVPLDYPFHGTVDGIVVFDG